jgi:2-dehydropantoate 2-reductase
MQCAGGPYNRAMKIAILGAGALGSILAAYLARAGEEVILLGRGERAKLLQTNGVSVHVLDEFTQQVEVVTEPAKLDAADILINTVKTYDTEPALAPLRHVKLSGAVSVQNGVLKDDQLATAFGQAVVLGATADFSGEVAPDGSVLFTRNIGFYVGELPSGVSPRVEAFVAALENAGIHAKATQNIQTFEWSKYVSWMGLSSVAVLSRQLTHKMMQDPDLARLQVTLVREGESLAAALEIPLQDMGGALRPLSLSTLPEDEAVTAVQNDGIAFEAAGVTQHKMSALQDAERGRRLEVEETLGDAVRRAGELGLAVPALETCYRLLSALNRGVTGP